MPTPKSVLWIQ